MEMMVFELDASSQSALSYEVKRSSCVRPLDHAGPPKVKELVNLKLKNLINLKLKNLIILKL